MCRVIILKPFIGLKMEDQKKLANGRLSSMSSVDITTYPFQSRVVGVLAVALKGPASGPFVAATKRKCTKKTVLSP